jgi:hypothetical protein
MLQTRQLVTGMVGSRVVFGAAAKFFAIQIVCPLISCGWSSLLLSADVAVAHKYLWVVW